MPSLCRTITVYKGLVHTRVLRAQIPPGDFNNPSCLKHSLRIFAVYLIFIEV